MNFLAHLLLSGEDENVILGNYSGDFIKGRLTGDKITGWNEQFLLGVKLHRYIDMFTDAHPVVREAKREAALRYGRAAGIVLDIYFDYFLARYFHQFSAETLESYSQRMYALIERKEYLIPDVMKRMARTMIRQNWLMSYQNHEGIRITFGRLSQRAAFLGIIIDANEDLADKEEFYHEKFNIFFPQLQFVANRFLAEGGML